MNYDQVYGDLLRFAYDPVVPHRSPPPHLEGRLPHDTAPPPVTLRLDKDYHYYVLRSKTMAPPRAPKDELPPMRHARSWYEDNMRGPTPVLKDERYKQPYAHTPQQTPYNTAHQLDIPAHPPHADELPAMMEPTEYLGRYEKDFDNADVGHGTAQPGAPGGNKNIQHDLVKRVMNPPMLKFKLRKEIDQDQYYETEYTILGFLVLHIFEMICGIVSTTISAILIDRDNAFEPAVYRYILADLIITLVISLLFVTRAINYESRNGVFYSVCATILKIASFVLVVADVLPNDDCKSNICPMRQTLALFIIICTFLWVINLVIFLTTVYVLRLDLFQGLPQNYSLVPGDALPPQVTPSQAVSVEEHPMLLEKHLLRLQASRAPSTLHPPDLVPDAPGPGTLPLTGGPPPTLQGDSVPRNDYYEYPDKKPLPEYFLTDDGEMYEMAPDVSVKGKQKVVLYF